MKSRWFRADRGSAIVELALTLPILVLVVAAAVDFARAFYLGMTLQNAARAGAQWGAHVLAQSANPTGMQTTASNAYASSNIAGASFTATQSCECATNAGVFSATTPAGSCGGTCGGGAHLVVTVTVTGSAPFNRALPGIPFMPNSMTLTRTAKMRALP